MKFDSIVQPKRINLLRKYALLRLKDKLFTDAGMSSFTVVSFSAHLESLNKYLAGKVAWR